MWTQLGHGEAQPM